MGNLGFSEIMIILVVVLLVFGAKRLPEIGASMGKGIREFKRSISEAGDAVTQLSRDAWIARIEASNAARKADAPKPTTTADIQVLDRVGDSAVVRVNLFRDGKQIFTDYISLYRFDAGWKLVGKIFHRH